jgi:hypothetical protein
MILTSYFKEKILSKNNQMKVYYLINVIVFSILIKIYDDLFKIDN